jgi:predicted esterase
MALALSLAACGDDDGPSSPDTGTSDAGDTSAPDDTDTTCTDDTCEPSDAGTDVAPDDTGEHHDVELDVEPPPGALFPDGEFVVGVSLAPVGGLELFFRVEADEGVLALFAWDGTNVSDELGRTESVTVVDDAFLADFGTATLPPAFSPTGGAVVVEFVLEGTFRADGSACGALDGNIVTLRLPLEGSTFGLVDWSERGERELTGCVEREPIPRLETCPEIRAGVTTDFPSGDTAREFELVLPTGYDGSESYPLLFAFHGFGGTPASLLDVVDLRDYADLAGLIIVAPLGLDTGNGPLWNVTAAPAFNEDVALFDDLLTCISDQYAVNPDRVYATGMSYGGLMTGMLLTSRTDVLAAAAPFSGGFIRTLDPAAPTRPVIAIWGGETDAAFDQDFDNFATSMTAALVDAGSFVVACDHGEGHVIREDWWPWAIEFLLDHPRGTDNAYADTLPEAFPSFCTIVD